MGEEFRHTLPGPLTNVSQQGAGWAQGPSPEQRMVLGRSQVLGVVDLSLPVSLLAGAALSSQKPPWFPVR